MPHNQNKNEHHSQDKDLKSADLVIFGRITKMTDKERTGYVQQRYFECIKPITNVRKGSGCNVGEHYWFEYVHDTYYCENTDAPSFYRKLSDNNRYDEVYITDEELINNFKEVIKETK